MGIARVLVEIQQFGKQQEQEAGQEAHRRQELSGRRQSRLLTCDAFVARLLASASLLKKMVLVTKVVVGALPLRSAEGSAFPVRFLNS